MEACTLSVYEVVKAYCKCASNDPARDTVCCRGKKENNSFSQVSKWWNLHCRGRLSWNAWEITHCIDILSESFTAEDREVKQINPVTKERAELNTVHSVCKVNSLLSIGRSVYNCCAPNQSPLLIPTCWQQLLSHWSQNNKSHQAFFRRRPASFSVNCIEEESNVRMESNFKTHSGKALKIAWALRGEESRSHTDFSITLLFPNNVCLSGCNSHFL